MSPIYVGEQNVAKIAIGNVEISSISAGSTTSVTTGSYG